MRKAPSWAKCKYKSKQGGIAFIPGFVPLKMRRFYTEAVLTPIIYTKVKPIKCVHLLKIYSIVSESKRRLIAR